VELRDTVTGNERVREGNRDSEVEGTVGLGPRVVVEEGGKGKEIDLDVDLGLGCCIVVLDMPWSLLKTDAGRINNLLRRGKEGI
jgi:hypothetical protein